MVYIYATHFFVFIIFYVRTVKLFILINTINQYNNRSYTCNIINKGADAAKYLKNISYL